MKKLTSILLIFCMVFLVTTPALAKKGGGFSRPKATPTSPTTSPSSPSKTTDQPSGTQGTTNQGTGDKIPYTNLNSSKTNAGAGVGAAAGAASNVGRSNLSGFRPSFSPFSGNFWMWMFLMNSFGFGHSQPAAAQTGEEVAANGTNDESIQASGELYTPSVGEYWETDPMANTISTLILVAVIALPIIFFMKWRKKRAAYR